MTSPYSFFFFTATATTEIYTLSLHDALPICPARRRVRERAIRISLPVVRAVRERERLRREATGFPWFANTSAPIISSPSMSQDRKSTRLNSSHVEISYAVFCLKKKKKKSQKY